MHGHRAQSSAFHRRAYRRPRHGGHGRGDAVRRSLKRFWFSMQPGSILKMHAFVPLIQMKCQLRTLCAALLTMSAVNATGAEVSGSVSLTAGGAVANTRMTLFRPDLRFFRETRSDPAGVFTFANVPNGNFQLGAAAIGYDYREITLPVSGPTASAAFSLLPETQPGRWTIVGSTSPEIIEGTGSGTVLPTGEMMVCHDTMDPITFDGLSQTRWFPPGSGSEQGCHVTTMLTNGHLFVVGGSMGGNPQDPIPRTVKLYNRTTNAWSTL